jgi:hypothetical protein
MIQERDNETKDIRGLRSWKRKGKKPFLGNSRRNSA